MEDAQFLPPYTANENLVESSNAATVEAVRLMQHRTEKLQTLLSLSQAEFWRLISTNNRAVTFLDSFLRHAPRSLGLEALEKARRHLGKTADDELRGCVMRMLLRISSSKESATVQIDDARWRDIVNKQGVINASKLLDVAAHFAFSQ